MHIPNTQLEELHSALLNKGVSVTQGSDQKSLIVTKNDQFRVTTNDTLDIIIENLSNPNESPNKKSIEWVIDYF
jgi:hypothetical protein